MTTVLLYTDSHSYCGVGSYNAALLSGLVRQGYRVACAQVEEHTPLQTRLQAAGVTYRWFDYDPNTDIQRFANDHRLAETVFDEVNPDLIVFSNGYPTNTFAGVRTARTRQIPYLIWEGHVRREAFSETQIPFDAVKQNYLAAKAAIFVAQQNLDIVKTHFDMPEGFGLLIPTFAATVFFEPVNPKRRSELRAKWGVPKDGIVCFTSAKFEPVKGYEVQIRALQKLRETPHWRRFFFAWAGDGTYRGAVLKRLRALGLKDHVYMPGHVWNLPDYLDAADMLSLTSFAEGLPLTVLEGMAKGLPVIATDVGGNRDALEGCGEVISAPTDVEQTANELATTVIEWAENPEHRLQLAAKSRARAVSDYSEEIVIGRQMTLINQLLNTD